MKAKALATYEVKKDEPGLLVPGHLAVNKPLAEHCQTDNAGDVPARYIRREHGCNHSP